MGAQLAIDAGNPYAPGLAMLDEHVEPVAAQTRKLDKCRRTIRFIGFLYYLSGSAAALLTVGYFLSPLSLGPNSSVGTIRSGGLSQLDLMMIAVLHGANTVLLFSVGDGLRRLEKSALWWARGLAIVNLLNPPVGTVVSICFLIQLFRPSTKLLFDTESEETQLDFVHSLVGEDSPRKVSWGPILGLLLLLFAMTAIGIVALI